MNTLLTEPVVTWQRLEHANVAAALGRRETELPASALAVLANADLRYTEITGMERDACLLQAMQALEADLPVSGPGAIDRWERGWRENLEAYVRGEDAVESLRPRYYKHTVLRSQGRYIRPACVTFEEDYYTIIRHVLFQQHLSQVPAVVEFGCGTGTSLLILAEMFPDTQLIGCDWTRSSQDLLRAISQRTGKHVLGVHCDMFAPQDDIPFPDGAAVMTMASMEQLGAKHGPFLEYLVAKRPTVCLHLEPIVELYDEQKLFDHVAIRYHQKRGYLTGFLPALRELEAAGRVTILDVRRLHFGSYFHEGYSVVVWRVRGGANGTVRNGGRQ